jgi:23S rRNA pseudouridine955/2504/2580 synthase/23S rRNA pseudouridine1911/1915/1917 synthase
MKKSPQHLKQIEIIYEDEYLIILNKPSGLLSIPDRFKVEKPNLYTMLKEQYGTIFTVHRLDFETTGAIVFAKQEEVYKAMNALFEHREITKIYLALVEGVVQKDEGEIDLAIAEDPVNRGKMRIQKDGKAALSFYHVLERFRHYSWLAVELKTGRTHQARLHLKSIGHPLAVDAYYGNHDAFYLSTIKKKYKFSADGEERPLLARHSLHAASLRFIHPITSEEVEALASLPKDLLVTLESLRKFDI